LRNRTVPASEIDDSERQSHSPSEADEVEPEVGVPNNSRFKNSRQGRKWIYSFHSFSSLSYDRSKASSKASSPHSAIQSFLLQVRVSSPFLKVIQ